MGGGYMNENQADLINKYKFDEKKQSVIEKNRSVKLSPVRHPGPGGHEIEGAG